VRRPGTSRSEFSIQEAADRAAIQDLVDAWAHFADRREPERQAALFTTDGVVSVYAGDPATNEPLQRVQGQAALAEAFHVLDTYDVTSHVTGQSTITFQDGGATGETYCLAHHLWVEDGQRTLMVMSIRYLDTFVRHGDGWLFAERQLVTDWTDKRPSSE
jgi:hypothetical protein